jgi:integrase
MASVFKRKRKVKQTNGKTVTRQSAKWHIKYIDADGVERRVVAYKDKVASQQLAAKLEKEAELAKAGVVDRYKEHRKTPLAEHLEDFKKSLSAKGNTKEHVMQTVQRVKNVFEGCRLATWNNLQASKVQSYIASLRDNQTGIAASTFNCYLQATKQFCKWMVQDRRASESPLEHLKCETIRKVVDEEHPRRALEIDELRRLLEVTKAGIKRFGMTGYERYLLYRFAAETGLRAKELRSLKVCSFDLANLIVRVSGACTKNKREAVQPLRMDTAEELKRFFSGKMPNVKAFGGTSKKLTIKTADMLKADLADADIPYVVNGLYFDFHALRHQTGTLLAVAGIHPKVAQSIMRHSDINLTLSRYTHTLTGQEAKAVEAMPDLSLPSRKRQKVVATGTDGKSVDTVQSGLKKLTPQLTPTAYPECDQPAAVGNMLFEKTEKALSYNSLQGGTLDTKKKVLPSNVTNNKAIRPGALKSPVNVLSIRW